MTPKELMELKKQIKLNTLMARKRAYETAKRNRKNENK